jgi:hypothetical protein
VKQESLFCWIEWARDYGKGHMDYERNLKWELRQSDQIINFEQKLAAFTVAELGEMLPKFLIMDEGGMEEMRFDLNIWKDHGWHVAYWWDEDTRRLSDTNIEQFAANTEADARASAKARSTDPVPT